LPRKSSKAITKPKHEVNKKISTCGVCGMLLTYGSRDIGHVCFDLMWAMLT